MQLHFRWLVFFPLTSFVALFKFGVSICNFILERKLEAFHESQTDLQIILTVKDIVINIPGKECSFLN
mgnify:FL=1